jgi:hypothetical protein
MLKKIIERMKKTRYRNTPVKKIEKSLRGDMLVFLVAYFIWFIVSFISIGYAYTIDPVLALVAFGFLWGVYCIILLMLILFKRTYVFLRKITDMWDKEDYE